MSSTQSCPWASSATPAGNQKRPGSDPPLPHCARIRPPGDNTRILPEPGSDAYTVPLRATAMPAGHRLDASRWRSLLNSMGEVIGEENVPAAAGGYRGPVCRRVQLIPAPVTQHSSVRRMLDEEVEAEAVLVAGLGA